MSGILEKLADALSMFWQALDSQEQYLVAVALIYAAFLVSGWLIAAYERRLVRRVAKRAAVDTASAAAI